MKHLYFCRVRMQRKIIFQIRCLLTILFAITTSLGAFSQSPKIAAPFPTYHQLKSAHQDYDYISPRGESAVERRINLNLFNYPANSVTYILNSQPTTDKNYVRELLKRKDIELDHILVEQPDSCGKRRIKITYSLH
ncbi:hypothetical protein [Spirosoma daeguense]